MPTYLENRFRIRPAGVVSKKLMGERNMAKAILSCNLRAAYRAQSQCVRALQIASGRRLTSIEQKIQSISVCTTTSAAEPTPKAK